MLRQPSFLCLVSSFPRAASELSSNAEGHGPLWLGGDLPSMNRVIASLRPLQIHQVREEFPVDSQCALVGHPRCERHCRPFSPALASMTARYGVQA